jgi:hypothetical protein
MGIFIYKDSILFHKLTSVKNINKVISKLEAKFPIEVLPTILEESNFYKYQFKESISGEILTEAEVFINQFNRNA